MAGGVFFFGFFLLDKQKKESRQSGETDIKTYGAMPYSYCALLATRAWREVDELSRQDSLLFVTYDVEHDHRRPL